MKATTTIILFLFVLFAITISCGRNRLKTDEKSLAKQILTEEQQLAQEAELRTEREKQLADSIAKLPKGFRFKEQRGIDAQKPPVVIDIAGSLNNINDLKLSDVASDIKYICIESVPDPNLPRNLKYKYYLMDNYIVAINLYGIHLFSKEGKFIRTVVKNELTGVDYDEKDNRLSFLNDYTLIGGGTSVWGRGNSLFYTYSNFVSGERYIMEYDCSQDQAISSVGFNPENKNPITGLGEVQFDLNHGKTTPPPPRKHQGMLIINPEGIYERLGIFSPDRNTYMSQMGRKRMWGVFSNQGDTV